MQRLAGYAINALILLSGLLCLWTAEVWISSAGLSGRLLWGYVEHPSKDYLLVAIVGEGAMDREVIVRLPVLFLFTAPLPAMFIVRTIRNRCSGAAAIAGLCPRCRYDLRATPNRCPECGTVPTPKNTSN